MSHTAVPSLRVAMLGELLGITSWQSAAAQPEDESQGEARTDIFVR